MREMSWEVIWGHVKTLACLSQDHCISEGNYWEYPDRKLNRNGQAGHPWIFLEAGAYWMICPCVLTKAAKWSTLGAAKTLEQQLDGKGVLNPGLRHPILEVLVLGVGKSGWQGQAKESLVQALRTFGQITTDNPPPALRQKVKKEERVQGKN
ncbi:hypothetical protein GWK47_026937 [Chionoecetes opilio]|uniref:Uncharacterized protein n=1 Tax=Chionoecetes opilio TaxID=41210 RepID=A0A8J8WCP8_CHIOP|nr:hypothetical protein GWK47_026937 [Chionoecetes opilio]